MGAQQLDVPHTLDELEYVLARRERGDADEGGRAGFGIGGLRAMRPSAASMEYGDHLCSFLPDQQMPKIT